MNKCRLLVLCTGNSARSIMAEALFNTVGSDYFEAYSAGSDPSGKINPFALEQIKHLVLDYEPRSKNWDEFSGDGAPILDMLVVVCDGAAQTVCPSVPVGTKVVAWTLPDPAAVTGSNNDKSTAFGECFDIFFERIILLVSELSVADLQGVQLDLRGDSLKNIMDKIAKD